MATTQPMTHPIPDDEVHRYADWEVRPRERTLTVRGEAQKIGARAFDVLLALIRHADRTMSRAELLDAAWPALVVEENNLSVQISTLRRLLGATSIVNIAGLGYRLAAAPAKAPIALEHDVEPGQAVDPVVPSASSLIGRDDEIAALLPRLATARLITIVGTGGVGKSSLARSLLATTGSRWRDGAHWIDLATVDPGTDILALVGRSLGVVTGDDGLSSGDLLRSLGRIEALVVLDNCEHLLDAVGACVSPLLNAASALRWLATSQAPLRLVSEEVFRLRPLFVAAAHADEAAARACSALALFERRMQAADRSLVLESADVELALDLCRSLDGLPLAIEMAAARVATLGLRSVHAQLDLRTLRSMMRDGPARHHTLQQAYAWSYGLLSPVEQRVFRSLQPFQGGFTADLFEAFVSANIEAGNDDPIDLLASLVDKSLVQQMPFGECSGDKRYRLLESARHFAKSQLQDGGEVDEVRARHAEAVAGWFDSAEDDWRHWRDAQWFSRYVPERGNVVVATAWACGPANDSPNLLARVLAAGAQLEVSNGDAGIFRNDVPLDRLDKASPPLRARACSGFGWAHYLDGNSSLGARLLSQAVDDYETIGDLVGLHQALTRLIRLYRAQPDTLPAAEALWSRLERMDLSAVPLQLRIHFEVTVARHFDPRIDVDRLAELGRLARHAGFDAQAMICQVNLTDQLLLRHRYEDALAVASTGTALPTGSRFLRWHSMLAHNQALALVRLGRIDDARSAVRQMLRGVPDAAHLAMDLLALALIQLERFKDAALLTGRSARIKRDRHCGSEEAEAAMIADTLQTLGTELGADELARLQELGASMTSGDVLAMAGAD